MLKRRNPKLEINLKRYF
uniref:Uncharacterized protein n=1 Tax=Rhizophora mucronata TaxID=61149 RepID=A0A2P2MWS7_RHIMU